MRDAHNPSEEEIFAEALRRSTPGARTAYLQQACGTDEALRRRVEILLHAHDYAGQFLNQPAAAASAKTMLISTAMLPVAEKPGDRIGHYKLLQQIGEGGCGVVYMAEQLEPVKRRVALKVIKPGMDTRQVLARFEAERQALALMDHPNIAKVLDAGATDTGRPFFVMELVRGIKITDYCDDPQNNLSTEQRLGLFIQVCRAIQHAHQKGIIHRDIKPSNILVTLQEDGTPTPKIIDFGIAKATAGQTLTDKTLFTAFEQFIGTPAYMSPEQAAMTAADVDTRSDIYSLGVLLYELLTGQTPFESKRLFEAGLDEIRRIIREEEPPRPSTRLSSLDADEQTTVAKHRHSDPPKLVHMVRGDLDWIVMKCLEKDRTRRYETANGLVRDIERHLNNEPIVARPPSGAYRFQKMVRRNKLAFAATTAVAASLILGLAASTRLWILEREARANEASQRQKAEAAEKIALTQAERADRNAVEAQAAALEARNALAASDFLQAARLISEDDGVDALAYLNRSLSLDQSSHATVARLANLLGDHTWMKPTLTLKHSGPVRSAHFSPDGKRIVTGSWDNTARLWDGENGQALTPPLQHKDRVVSAEFSPDGHQVATASYDGVARLWDAQSGLPRAEPLKHGHRVLVAHFSPDGRRIVTGSFDNTARLWDAQSGQALTEPLKHEGAVCFAEFSFDSKKLLTASSDGTARVWDTQTGLALTRPLRHKGPVVSARFSLDGSRIVTASEDKTARLWDAQNGKALGEPLSHNDFLNSAQFSPDGQWIVTSSWDQTARVWDARNGRALNHPLKHAGRLESAQFSPGGSRIVTSSWDHTARVWDAKSGQALTQSFKHSAPVIWAEFSPDSRRIITASYDNTARVWDALSGPALPQPLRHNGPLSSAQFSPDGQRIVTASHDNSARVWDAPTGRTIIEPLKHNGAVVSARFSRDGKRIVTASVDHTARVWDARSGQAVTGPLEHNGAVVSAQFSPDGKRIVTASHDYTARVWDAQTGQALTAPLLHKNWVVSAQFSPDGKKIVTASHDYTARVWDAQSGQALTAPLQHSSWVVSAQFSPDGNRVVTGSGDQTARVWDALSGKTIIEALRSDGHVYWAQFSPDGKRILTASWDATARAWDALSGQPVDEPFRHRDQVYAAGFSADGKRIVTASEDHTARVWDVHSGQPLTEPLKHDGAVYSAEFSCDGKRIVTASEDHTARVWDTVPPQPKCPDWLLQLSEVISGQVVNKQGVFEETQLNRAETINQIREQLSRELPHDDWLIWGRWFLADPATRTISPFSTITVPEHIENLLREAAPNSLDEAESLAFGDATLLERVAVARKALEETRPGAALKSAGKD